MASRARARSTWAAGALSERLRRVKVFRSLGVSGRRGSFWRRDMGHLGARGSSHHYTKAHGRGPTSCELDRFAAEGSPAHAVLTRLREEAIAPAYDDDGIPDD